MTAPYKDLEYWRERHTKLRGDIRSVGRIDRPVAENLSHSKRLTSAIREVASDLKPLSVLDLGCGIGRLAQAFDCEYHGIDASDEALEQARAAYPTGRFTSCDLVEYPAGEKYDLVLAASVFVHLVDEERWKRALSLFCKSIGRVGLIMDNIPPTTRQPARHVMERSTTEYDLALRTHAMAFSEPLRQRFNHLADACSMSFVEPASGHEIAQQG